jgi:type IV pilus assembly protein PilB
VTTSESADATASGTSQAGPAGPQRAAATRRRLGDVLVESGLLTPEQLDSALEQQRVAPGARRRLGQVVVDLGYASERDVAEALANLLGLRMIDLSKAMPAPDVVRQLPRQVAERTRVLVLDKTARGLVIAAADPTNVLAIDDVKLYTRSPEVEVLVATESQIRDQIARAWSIGEDSTPVSAIVEETGDDDEGGESAVGIGDDDAPIVKLVNRVLADAVRMRASDIHVEVQRDGLLVRYRIDGLLQDVLTAPRRLASAVISRIKIMSGLDIAERRVPQDGRTRIVLDNLAIDARISTLPALHGEKVVIRLLTRGDDVPTLKDLGFEPEQLKIFEAALAVPQGLILITGPTGSGKTNTLYSAIAQIKSPEKNIVTLEDPVEVQLPGITQVGVNLKTGMTFAAGLRSILRQDPDIVLVGEVRDGETAELALKASLTGHLVLTTLHTNSAVAALTRLVDMGAQPFLVASSLTAAIAQRLVRRPCESCAAPHEPDEVTLALLGLRPSDITDATPLKGSGCQECSGTGYRGRTAVYEVLSVDAAMRKVLVHDPSESAIATQARAANMLTLRAAAIDKARRGETTFEEAIRVTQADSATGHRCPACERKVESDMVACPWCGVTLDRGHCSECARELDPDWRMCPWCRTPATEPAAPSGRSRDRVPQARQP